MKKLLCVSLLLFTVFVRAESAPAKATVRIDTTDAPELQAWAEKAKAALEQFYPTMAGKLGLEDSRELTLVVRKDVKGSGSVAGSKVTLGADYYTQKPDEIGTIVFLLTRSLQTYSAKDAPGWMVTGIADYIRWQTFEPAEKRKRISLKSSKYTNGFGDAAAFFAWIERTHDKDVIRKLHQALVKGTYTDGLLKEIAGKNAPELWPDFVASLRKDADDAAAKNIDPTIAKPQPAKTTVEFSGVGEVTFADAPEKHTLRYTLDGSFPTAKSPAYCVPVRVASTLKLRAAIFNQAGKCSELAEVSCVSSGEGEKPSVAINVDVSQAPELKEWALKAQKECTDHYGTMIEMLKSDGYKASRQIVFYFVEEESILGPGIPAFALPAESVIYFRAEHIRRNQNDFGMTIHELCHVVQNYVQSRNSPSWLVEGIADWMRWENWEPVNKRRRVDPLRAKYTNGYSDTARFLTWMGATHDKDIVRKLNAALRVGKYSDAMFKDAGGKEIAELWKDFVASLQK